MWNTKFWRFNFFNVSSSSPLLRRLSLALTSSRNSTEEKNEIIKPSATQRGPSRSVRDKLRKNEAACPLIKICKFNFLSRYCPWSISKSTRDNVIYVKLGERIKHFNKKVLVPLLTNYYQIMLWDFEIRNANLRFFEKKSEKAIL